MKIKGWTKRKTTKEWSWWNLGNDVRQAVTVKKQGYPYSKPYWYVSIDTKKHNIPLYTSFKTKARANKSAIAWMKKHPNG